MSIKGLVSALVLLCTTGCVQLDPILSESMAPLTQKLLSNINRQQVRVVFLNRLSGERLVPMLSSVIDTLSFDGIFERKSTDYKETEGIQEVLPFIEPGEHFIKIKFRQNAQPSVIPIVIPNTSQQKMTLLVIVANTSQTPTIKVGYDLDNNLEVDTNKSFYQSNDGQKFLEYQPDGTVQEWKSNLSQDSTDRIVPEPNSQALPPGADSVKPNSGQPLPKVEKEHRPPPIGVPQIPQQKPIPIPVVILHRR